MQTETRPKEMFDILATTIIMLFGGDADKAEEENKPAGPEKTGNNYYIYPGGRR